MRNDVSILASELEHETDYSLVMTPSPVSLLYAICINFVKALQTTVKPFSKKQLHRFQLLYCFPNCVSCRQDLFLGCPFTWGSPFLLQSHHISATECSTIDSVLFAYSSIWSQIWIEK